MFNESINLLESVREEIPDKLSPDFYRCYTQVYDIYMSAINYDSHKVQYKSYSDSLAMVTKGREQFEPQMDIESLYSNLSSVEKWSPGYSFATYHLAKHYEEKGQIDSAKHYYTHSAISDIRLSNKDQGSLIRLAHLYHNEGNFAEAQRYASSSIEDAIEGNMKIRTIRLTELFKIIDDSYQSHEKQSKWSVIISLIVICGVILYAFYQNIKFRNANDELKNTREQLSEVNAKLYEQNRMLMNAHIIHERYISNFFDIGSKHINKLENYRHFLRKMVVTNKIDDLHRELKSNEIITNEIHDQLIMFDRIFMDIYPSFVEEFNSLLKPEQNIVTKPGELLNTEIRIYALMRIGFDNCEKIADFLRCTVPTVYTYRAKTRSRARMPKDEFEKAVMKIGQIHTEE